MENLLTISYDNKVIHTSGDNTSFTLTTADKYLDSDIEVFVSKVPDSGIDYSCTAVGLNYEQGRASSNYLVTPNYTIEAKENED